MATRSDAVDKARALLEQRRNELRSELDKIESALSGLGGSARRGPGRPRGSRSPARTGSRRRRGGTRGDQALAFVASKPGATAGEVASALGIKPNYVYRVMAGLEKDGKVRKDGKGYHVLEPLERSSAA